MSEEDITALIEEKNRVVRENWELRAELARRPAAPVGQYRCGCPIVASDRVKAFCPEHHKTIVEPESRA